MCGLSFRVQVSWQKGALSRGERLLYFGIGFYGRVSPSMATFDLQLGRARNEVRCGHWAAETWGRLRHPVSLTVTLSFILTVCCVCALALDPSLDVSQYAHTPWRVRDGFVKGAITSLAQSSDGYLWLGTELGLLRFDGLRAVPWQPPPGQHLPGSLIVNLLSARDGTLWIGTFTGVASWKDGKLTQVAELANQDVTSLLEARDGTVWFGSYGQSGGKLCDIRNQVVHCETLASGIKALYEDTKRTLWVGLSDGFWRWRPGTPEFFSTPNEPFGIISFAEDEQGYLLFGSHAGIKRLVDGHFEPYPSSGSRYRWQVTQMFPDHDGGLWVGTAEHGLVHIQKKGKADAFSHIDGLSGDYVTRFLEDREDNTWVATFDGIDRFREYASFTITTMEGLSSNVAWSVLGAKDGSVWIGTDGALNHWENGRISLFGNGGTERSEGKLAGRQPLSLFQDSGQRIWVSNTIGKVGYLQGNYFIPTTGLPSGVVHAIAEVPSGHIWIANQQSGLFELVGGHVVRHMLWSEFGDRDFAKIMIADPSQNGLWLGFNEGGVVYLADSKIRQSYSAGSGLTEGVITDLRFGNRGALWAASAGGLTRIKDGHLATITSENGLPCDRVAATVEDNDHSMWLYLACGMVRITQGELDAWVGDPRRALKITLFDISDGVRSHAASQPAPLIAKSKDGRIWFLPWDGVSVTDPRHLPINKIPPPVHIEQITADGKTYDPAQGLQLPARVQHIDIDYTALSLVAPEKNRFRFMLKGYDRDWQDVGNRRQAFYTNLPARNYHFRVIASNNGEVWNETGESLSFSVLPAFYQTNWFRVFCFFGFLALLWSIYEFRVRQLRRQFAIRFEARVNERTRIARELHDTLLQNLHGLMFQFQAVRNLMARRPEEAMRSLDEAIDETERAIGESRDAIQGLRSEPIAKGNLAELLTATSRDLATSENSQPIFELIEEGERRKLATGTKNEICRIALEILRNAYRHAQAHRIEAEVRYGEDVLRLRIRDDGKGIDPKVLKEGGIAGHFGLQGIRERAKRIGATLDLWSQAGAGTEAQLIVPASVAYENGGETVGAGFRRKVKNRAHNT